jgi:hypothetical protein
VEKQSSFKTLNLVFPDNQASRQQLAASSLLFFVFREPGQQLSLCIFLTNLIYKNPFKSKPSLGYKRFHRFPLQFAPLHRFLPQPA